MTHNASLIENLLLLTSPVGVAFPFFGEVEDVPQDWVPYLGQELSRVDYAKLFAVFGTLHGVGDGSTTFNMPDLRGRVPVGADLGADRVTAANLVGQSGGAEKHALTASEMPSHRHGKGTLATASAGSHTHSGTTSTNGAHTHAVYFGTNFTRTGSGYGLHIGPQPQADTGQSMLTAGNHNHTFTTDSAGAHTHSITGDTDYAGSNSPHNNMQPYTNCIWIGWTGKVTLAP